MGAPGGFFALRAAGAAEPLSMDWLLEELVASQDVYLYVSISSALVLTLLGYIVGLQEDRLIRSSTTDELTGLANRRHFRDRLTDSLARTDRYGTPLSLLLVDLDDLKGINDVFGHAAGDAALRAVAAVLRRSCRQVDFAARIGGDEFAVLVPEAKAPEAAELADRIRANLARLPAQLRRVPVPLTVSVGVADHSCAADLSAEALLALADEALYTAKRHGRDRAATACHLCAGACPLHGRDDVAAGASRPLEVGGDPSAARPRPGESTQVHVGRSGETRPR